MSCREILTDNEYINIVDKYLQNDKVQHMKNIPHHDSNRLDHCLKVSYLSYKVSKKLHLNYESVAKAGLLHDLYHEQIDDFENMKDKMSLFMNDHPATALQNAKTICDLSTLEENIILSHMWPASKYKPKFKESFVVGGIDKFVSIKEFKNRNAYKLSFKLGVYFILLTCFMFKN